MGGYKPGGAFPKLDTSMWYSAPAPQRLYAPSEKLLVCEGDTVLTMASVSALYWELNTLKALVPGSGSVVVMSQAWADEVDALLERIVRDLADPTIPVVYAVPQGEDQ